MCVPAESEVPVMGSRRRFTPEYRRDVASLVLDTGGVWVFRTVCFERVVLSSPGCLWPGGMDGHQEVFEAHA